MRTEHRKHIRLITRADLFVPGSTTADGSIQGQEQERIVALKLWKLRKDDHWFFEDPSILSHFVGGMFLQLSQLTARAWDGVTFAKGCRLDRLFISGREYVVREEAAGASERVSVRTLTRLCLVNKHLSLVVIPFLMEDLLRMSHNLHHPHSVPRSRDHVRSLLINSDTISVSELHPALVLELELDKPSDTTDTSATITNTTTPAPDQLRVNHLRHIRNVNLNKATFSRYSNSGYLNKGQQPYSAEVLNYIHSPEFMSSWPSTGIASACSRHSDPTSLSLALFPIVVYREVIWALAAPHLNQMVSLSMPLSDTRRYLDVVARLGKLEFIHVVVDLQYGCGRCGHGVRGTKNRPCRDEAMQVLVQLVKDHRQRFPGRLKTVTSSEVLAIWSALWSRSIEIQNAEIQRMLPPYQPQALNCTNWPRIAPFLESTDFSRVRDIRGLEPNAINPRFLQRCRRLVTFSAESFQRGYFDWAVREKQESEASLGQGAVGSFLPEAASSSLEWNPNGGSAMPVTLPLPPLQASFVTRPLVPLAKLSLYDCDIDALPDINAIATAFCNTLESLFMKFKPFHGPIKTILVGQGCTANLPCLTYIRILAHGHRLALDPFLLTHCPKLVWVEIVDNTREYTCEVVVPHHPADLPRVIELELRGLGALGFHPDTLKTTRNLRVLTLLLMQSKCCFIPPINELKRSYGLVSAEKKNKDKDKSKDERGDGDDISSPPFVTRPRWTWDWQLPNLTTLRLNSEFAYWFEFKMLHGCQALERLSLHMRTTFGHHTRVITQADLVVPGAGEGSQERIVAGSLRRLYMNGHWSFENPSVLMQFVGRMFPKLEHLTAKAWEDVTVGLFVKAIRIRSRAIMAEAAAAAIVAGVRAKARVRK
ncbi:hypothetical protein F5H01DRAFT_319017 [Linnemannia elongata]|nr:hypothetical protein F5H01DRAFT_319017 [Linnemannia elongata]